MNAKRVATELPPPPYEEVFGKVSSKSFQVAMATRCERVKAASNKRTESTNDATINLYNAIKEKDKDLILQILCERNKIQRLEIAKIYQVNYNKTIARDIEEDFDNKSAFSVLMCGLTIPNYKLMARMIHRSQRHCNWINCVLFVLRNDERVNMKHYFKASMLATTTLTVY